VCGQSPSEGLRDLLPLSRQKAAVQRQVGGKMKELSALFEVILDRKNNPVENSYTSYLFDKGLDKILKKCGEECSEMIIAAKSLESAKHMMPNPAISESNHTDLQSVEYDPNKADTQTLIFAKNISDKQTDLENEICDLIYHIEVLMGFFDISPDNIDRILKERSLKIGNLKSGRDVDLNS
jgi:phosphoribosyl-ATP pyrophosphohydrolase